MGPVGRFICAGFLLLTMAAPAFADCGTHVVRPGDTLRKIALQYLGTKDASGRVYALNRSAVGADPNTIEVGTRLAIPCRPGAKPANPQPVAEKQPPQPAATPYQILTGGPFVPFTGEDLDQGGLVTELLRAALHQSSDPPDYEISYVNDRGAHLGIVLPRGGFDLSYPWVYPDCEETILTEHQSLLCSNFVASDPIYEYVVEYYVRADNSYSEAVLPGDLRGATVCRPAGYPLDDLVNQGLLPDDITVVTGTTPAACLALLDVGEVDVASMDAGVSRALVLQLTLENPLLVLDGLTSIKTLHVIGLKDRAETVTRLEKINEGLQKISESGEWYQIVQRQKSIPLN